MTEPLGAIAWHYCKQAQRLESHRVDGVFEGDVWGIFGEIGGLEINKEMEVYDTY